VQEGRRQHFDTLTDRAEGFYEYCLCSNLFQLDSYFRHAALAETHPIPFLAGTDGLFVKDEIFFALLEAV